MKRNLLIALSFIFILSSCSLNSDSNPENDDQEIILYTWHLIRTEGGFAGVEHQFELDTVVWSFDEINGTLEIDNTNTDDTKQDFLESGTYTFSIEAVNQDELYISIDSTEYGKINIGTNIFTIDENSKSTEQGADGFFYTFQRVTRAQ